jgi:hypothetical protein
MTTISNSPALRVYHPIKCYYHLHPSFSNSLITTLKPITTWGQLHHSLTTIMLHADESFTRDTAMKILLKFKDFHSYELKNLAAVVRELYPKRRVGMLVNFTSFNSGTQNGPPGRKAKALVPNSPGPPARWKWVCTRVPKSWSSL